MKRLAAGSLLALIAASATSIAQPAAGYARDARVAHLASALATLTALGEAGSRALELELHAGVRAACRPTGSRPPAIACMIGVARTACAKRPDPAGCTAAADIILTNQHAETELVDEGTRIRLVSTSTDYHAALNAELRSRYALLAGELALSAPGAAADAARIDRFCAERDRVVNACDPRATLCVPSIPWQRCAAGLVWFVSTGAGAKS